MILWNDNSLASNTCYAYDVIYGKVDSCFWSALRILLYPTNSKFIIYYYNDVIYNRKEGKRRKWEKSKINQ